MDSPDPATEPETTSEQESEVPSEENILDISRPSTAVSTLEPEPGDVCLSDPLFPFSPSFAHMSHHEKELIFMKAFEEKVLFIRNKELKSIPAPVLPLLTDSEKDEITRIRDEFFDQANNSEQRAVITRKTTQGDSRPAPRIDIEKTPTFNPLLNTNFNSQFALLAQFKRVISQIMTRNRVNKRTTQLTAHLTKLKNNAVKTLQERLEEQNELTALCLLSITPSFARDPLKFAESCPLEIPPAPEVDIQVHRIERPFKQYVPDLVERFQLTPFPRTDINSYVSAPITMPDKFPVVREEQPIRERVLPALKMPEPEPQPEPVPEPGKLEVPVDAQAQPQRVLHHPREVLYYSFDPAYQLRPQPIELPELPDECGKSCILATPLTEYQNLSLAGKTGAPFSPFEFFGVKKFADARLGIMTGPDPIDLRELEADDDIDNIDIKPKVRPVSDFITKPLNTKNKSHVLAEAVSESQTQWREKQRNNVTTLLEKLTAINKLMRDQTLALAIDDLQSYTL